MVKGCKDIANVYWIDNKIKFRGLVKMIKISVIIPVYKVEDYVERAIHSVLNQTLRDIECIVVDDGSPDDSGKLCDQCAQEDDRVIVFHKENGGAPSARNMAMKKAKGKYIYFMDADDWAEQEMLEDMWNLAESHEADYVVTGYYIDTYYNDYDYVTQRVCAEDAFYISAEDFHKQAYRYFDQNLLYTPWNKLYRSDLIQGNKIYFPNTLWDDFPFNLAYMQYVNRVVVSSKKYYHFIRKRAESETAAYQPKMYAKREEENQWMIALYQSWNLYTGCHREMIARRYVERLVGCLENIENPKCTMKFTEKYIFWKNAISQKSVKEALENAQIHSIYMKLILYPIRRQWVLWCMVEGWFISLVKRKNIKLFAKLKEER